MSKTVFVGSLPYKVTTQELKAFFRSCGNVVKVTIPLDMETGRSKGVGFVEMGSELEAREAIKNLSGRLLAGRKIFLSEAKPKDSRPADMSRQPGFVERRSGKDRRRNPPAAGKPGVRRAWSPKEGGPRKSSFGPCKGPSGPRKWSKDKPGSPAKKKWERRPSSDRGGKDAGGEKKWAGGKKKWSPKPGRPGDKPWSRQPPGRFAKKPGGAPKKGGFKPKGPRKPRPR